MLSICFFLLRSCVASLIRFLVGSAALLERSCAASRTPAHPPCVRPIAPRNSYSWTPLWHSLVVPRRTYALQTHGELECFTEKLRSSSLDKCQPLPQNLQNDLPGLVNQLQASTWRTFFDAEAEIATSICEPENEATGRKTSSPPPIALQKNLLSRAGSQPATARVSATIIMTSYNNKEASPERARSRDLVMLSTTSCPSVTGTTSP